MSSKTRVVILGAGPSGVGAAYQLARSGKGAATVLERAQVVGGLAGSFELASGAGGPLTTTLPSF